MVVKLHEFLQQQNINPVHLMNISHNYRYYNQTSFTKQQNQLHLLSSKIDTTTTDLLQVMRTTIVYSH